MTPLSPYDVRMSSAGQPVTPNSNFSYTGANWFGPLQPMRPVAPPEVAGRVWDFIPGYNLTTQPRYTELVDFATLRALANAYDPLRLIIERRKDQMGRLPWVVRAKHDDSLKKRPATKDLPADMQARIKDITHFFKKPDRELTFRTWLRELLEDLFVLDAPTLFCERTRGGQLISLPVMDGGLIKRVIDNHGRSPRPVPWTGTPFMWNGKMVDIDNYQSLGFQLVPGEVIAHMMPVGVAPPEFAMLPPMYQQILKGLPAVDYSMRDIYYRPSNPRPGKVYGFSPVEQVVTTVNIAMRRSLSQLDYYREGNQPEGVFGLPETWTPDQAQKFQDYWDNLFRGNIANRRTMKFVPAGSKSSYVPFKEPPLKNEMDEWLTRIVCFAFSYPPQAFVHMMNRASGEQHEKQAEEEGLQPTKQWASELLNEIIEREFDVDDIEFAWVEEDEIDQEKQATILGELVDKGILTRNQSRERLGEEPDANEAANQLMVTTSTGAVPIDANLLDNKVAEAKALAAALPKPEPAAAPVGTPKAKGETIGKSAEKVRMRAPMHGAGEYKAPSGHLYSVTEDNQLFDVHPDDVEHLEAKNWTRESVVVHPIEEEKESA